MAIFKIIADCIEYYANPLDKNNVVLNFKNMTISSFIYTRNKIF